MDSGDKKDRAQDEIDNQQQNPFIPVGRPVPGNGCGDQCRDGNGRNFMMGEEDVHGILKQPAHKD